MPQTSKRIHNDGIARATVPGLSYGRGVIVIALFHASAHYAGRKGQAIAI